MMEEKICKVCKLKIEDQNFDTVNENEFVHSGYCKEFMETLNESEMDLEDVQSII